MFHGGPSFPSLGVYFSIIGVPLNGDVFQSLTHIGQSPVPGGRGGPLRQGGGYGTTGLGTQVPGLQTGYFQ